MDRNLEFLLTSHIDFLFIFGQCGDNYCKNKSVSEKKSGGHRMSKIVKSNQSYSSGHLPYHCSVKYLEWRSMDDGACGICERSKDGQKQLARTSLSGQVPMFECNLALLITFNLL